MSKPRYKWWSYVKAMIRQYPALAAEYEDLKRQSLTANYAGMPRGGAAGRTTEDVALREMETTKQREYEAVRRAVEATKRMRTGRDRLRVIKLVLWDNSCTLDGAALKVHISPRTARAYHGDFIRLVAKNYGLMDW